MLQPRSQLLYVLSQHISPKFRCGVRLDRRRVLLPVRRFEQKPGECALAAVACFANYFDPNVVYEDIRKMMPYKERKDGLHTAQIVGLLNRLGFTKTTVVSSDIESFDFSWNKLDKRSMIRRLKMVASNYQKDKDTDNANQCWHMANRLADDECDNNLLIDYDFHYHAKMYLRLGTPVITSIEWTKLFRYKKSGSGRRSDVSGHVECHSFVLRGYNDRDVFVADSHIQYYVDDLIKYRKGYYPVRWTDFCSCAVDLILVQSPRR